MALQFSFVALLVVLATTNAARDSQEGEFPFQVSVKDLHGEHLCGGVIITSKWVLTSADCAKNSERLEIGYGAVDTKTMTERILSERIEIQKDMTSPTNALALIELKSEIKFNSRAKQIKIPRQNVRLVNGTITGWKADEPLKDQWTLKVIDTNELTYVSRDCKTLNGNPVYLGPDQFCLILDAAEHTNLASVGAVLTRGDVFIGFHTQKKLTPLSPIIFLEMSHHGQWIADTLQGDSTKISWANTVPSSADPQSAINLAVIVISYFFSRYF